LRFDPGSVLRRHLDGHALARQRAGNEHDPTVGTAAEPGAAGGDTVHLDGESWHHDQRMPTADPSSPPILITPSVLPADFARLGEECAALAGAGVDRIQFDVMDGRFVPNLTFGPDVIAAVRPVVTVPFEAHLMIEEPDHLVERFAGAGCGLIIVHAEACRHLHRTLGAVREAGAAAGVALNPHTPIDVVAHVLDLIDLLLVMTVNPGFGGQAYLATMEPKIAAARALLDTAGRWIDLEVDGGISAETVTGAAEAGANVLVSGSALFRHPAGRAEAVAELRQLATKAWSTRS
jgi:ribulose-phosphate 3-epimerase